MSASSTTEILAVDNEPVPEIAIVEDNQSCIKVTKNSVNRGRAKPIDIMYHDIRDGIKHGKEQLDYCKTTTMLVDSVTKALPRQRHKNLKAALGVHACSH